MLEWGSGLQFSVILVHDLESTADPRVDITPYTVTRSATNPRLEVQVQLRGLYNEETACL